MNKDAWLSERVILEHGYEPGVQYPVALVNVTNRCNLSCSHCFIYRDAVYTRRSADEIETGEMLEILTALRDRHGIGQMLWMGGEPLLRKDLIVPGVKLFPGNHIVTNGTLPLIDLGRHSLYVVSLDGPGAVNDGIRGSGTYRRVIRTLKSIPRGFRTPVQVQCVVTRRNEGFLGELVEGLMDTGAGWVTFSFYVAGARDRTGLGWPSLSERMKAVKEVMGLKEKYPGFVRNSRRGLELMSPEDAPRVTAGCLAKKLLLPLYLEGDRFRTPFCCYGNDVDCDTCGSWFVFELASRFGTEPF